jgi:hypothetical protein
MGVVKTPYQCKDKWDHTHKDFKKLWDYEQNTPSEKSSFWAMTRSEGKSALKLSTIMVKEVYDQLCSRLPGQSREFDKQNFMDTTTMNNPSGKYLYPYKSFKILFISIQTSCNFCILKLLITQH